MAETDVGDESSSPTPAPIHLIIKTAKDKETIDINPDATVEDLKKKVAEKFSTELECVCLIFAGKILKDFETLETHSKSNGLSLPLCRS